MQSSFPPQFFNLMDCARSLDSASSTVDITVDIKKQLATKAIRKRTRKCSKPNGKPKRPLSAYNIFFKCEREKLVQAKKKVGFSNMAKVIAAKWKELDTEDRKEYAAGAEVEQKKYRSAVKHWKENHRAEMDARLLVLSARSQEFDSVSPHGALLSQSDPMVLQRFMMEQQVLNQRNMMQAQMQNAANLSGGRRMSMPNMGTSPTTSTAPMFSNESFQQLLQQQQQEQYQQQPHATTGRRFSMPTNTTSAALQAQPVSSSFDFSLQDSYSADLTQSSYADSNEESSLDNATADMLINMPIMDMEEQLKLQEQPMQVPSSVAAITLIPTRRSSMPTLQHKKLENWCCPTPLMGGTTGRRLSMPQLSDERKEMQDILDLLDDDAPAFCSAMNSAA